MRELAYQRQLEQAYSRQELTSRQARVPTPDYDVDPNLACIRTIRRERYEAVDKREAKDLDGFVYVVTSPKWPGLVKVGKSRDPISRVGSANTWSPERCYVLEEYDFFQDYHAAERVVHQELAYCRVTGTEWFRIPTLQALSVLASIHMRN